MHKQINSEMSTKQLKKAKLLDSYRQQQTINTIANTNRNNRQLNTHYNNANKVMLTDLCPEQKAKIGDLVRTLQLRKCQNQRMQQKIKEYQSNEKKFVHKIVQLQKIMEQFQIKQQKYKQELLLCKVKEQERQKYIEHLNKQKQQRNMELIKRKNIAYVDQFALTQQIITINQGVQVNQKKKKCRQKQTQTQISKNSQFQFSRKYPNNSKSFQKIMKGRAKSSADEQYLQRKKSKSKQQKMKKSNIVIDDEQNCQDQINVEDYQQQQDQILRQRQRQDDKQQQDDEDDFNQLAKKWLQLKQKNMSKIKDSYRKSQQKVRSTSQQKSTRKIPKTIGIPRDFDDKNIVQQQQQGSHFQSQNLLQNNESFGPNRNKKSSHSGIKNAEIDQDFDEIELNKKLKSKNFSASSIMRKNREQSEQSQRHSHSKKQNIKERQKQKFKLSKASEVQNTTNMKASSASNSRSNHYNNIDFYQTDLLDIVSSINNNNNKR